MLSAGAEGETKRMKLVRSVLQLSVDDESLNQTNKNEKTK